jgi:hypothetical protein
MVAGSMSSRIRRSPGSRRVESGPELKTDPSQGRQLDQQLHQAADQGAPGHAGDGRLAEAGKSRASETPPTMEPRLKKLEDMAGTKKRPLVFRMPMTTAARAMKSRKGNMILVSRTVSSVLPGISCEIRGQQVDNRLGPIDAGQGQQADQHGEKNQYGSGQRQVAFSPRLVS